MCPSKLKREAFWCPQIFLMSFDISIHGICILLTCQVMEQTTDAEKAMGVYEFLDFKRKNKVSKIFFRCFLYY